MSSSLTIVHHIAILLSPAVTYADVVDSNLTTCAGGPDLEISPLSSPSAKRVKLCNCNFQYVDLDRRGRICLSQCRFLMLSLTPKPLLKPYEVPVGVFHSSQALMHVNMKFSVR